MPGLLGMQRFAQVTALSLLGLTGGTALASDQKQDTTAPKPNVTSKAACEQMTADINSILVRPDMGKGEKSNKIRAVGEYWQFSLSSQQIPYKKYLPTLGRIQARALEIIEDNTTWRDYDPKVWVPIWSVPVLLGLLCFIFVRKSNKFLDMARKEAYNRKMDKLSDEQKEELYKLDDKSINRLTTALCLGGLSFLSCIAAIPTCKFVVADGHEQVYPTLPDDICDQIKPDLPKD